MKPTKLSARVFHELPPVLAHLVETDRNPWLESSPKAGTMSLRERPGVFTELEDLAMQRALLVHMLGPERARAIHYRYGFELGQRDGARHYGEFKGNVRLALQAGEVFGQLEGKFVAETVRFEFDIRARTLYRELLLRNCAEALPYQQSGQPAGECVCWITAGYLSGHVSEILGRRTFTCETECIAKGDPACRFISKFDPEWDSQADWTREALVMETVEQELAGRDDQVAAARKSERRAKAALNDLNRRLRSDLMMEGLVADSPAMRAVLYRARQVAESDIPVLLDGEQGVGRETLARAIHFGGARKKRAFAAVDCGGLPEELLTQELFGFTKDAFAGASSPHPGSYRQAHRGTLYLDEVANLSLDAQIRLLRAMREGVVMSLGGETPAKADVRLIASTEHDLREKVAAGEFLENLYLAFAVAPIEIPPLRDRGTDIVRLAEKFLEEFRERYDREDLDFSQEFKQVLLDCAWPGNVRQLRDVVEHAVIMAQTNTLGLAELPEDILATRLKRTQKELSEEVVRAALHRTRGNRTEAAKLLGVGRTSLWRAMKRLRNEKKS